MIIVIPENVGLEPLMESSDEVATIQKNSGTSTGHPKPQQQTVRGTSNEYQQQQQQIQM